MRYNIYPEHYGMSIMDNILMNRGVDYSELEDWKEGSLDQVQSWKDLDNIEEFCAQLHSAMEENKNTLFVVDSDCDGFTSSAIMINFCYSIDKQFCYKHVSYALHEGKQHGLADIDVPDDIEVVVVMDAGTNDFEQQRALQERGKTVLIGDHHECDDPCFDYAVIVNNQLSAKYRNKDLSGAGIAWQICRAYNDIYNAFGKIDMDMAALGLAGDMMAYNSLETRAIIKNGLTRIMNPFMAGMIKKNDYSIRHKGGVHYQSIAYFVVPYVNAVMRVGNQEEKELLFKSMLDMHTHWHVPSTKRGEEGKYVELIDEALLMVERVKRRQTEIQDMMVEEAAAQIEKYDLLSHPILVIRFKPGQTASGMLGVIANKLQSIYQKPTLVFVDDGKMLKGSARNYAKSDIQDFRGYCRDSGLFSLAEGHASAFGAQMETSNLSEFLKKADEEMENSTEPVYWVDYEWKIGDFQAKDVLEIGDHRDYWGQQMDEPLIAISQIPVSKIRTELMSPDKKPTTKITLPNGVELIKFKSSMSEKDWLNRMYKFSVVGRCVKNEYMGNVKPEIIIDDWEVQDITKENFDWEF